MFQKAFMLPNDKYNYVGQIRGLRLLGLHHRSNWPYKFRFNIC